MVPFGTYHRLEEIIQPRRIRSIMFFGKDVLGQYGVGSLAFIKRHS